MRLRCVRCFHVIDIRLNLLNNSLFMKLFRPASPALTRRVVHSNFKVTIQIKVMIMRNTAISWWWLYVWMESREKFSFEVPLKGWQWCRHRNGWRETVPDVCSRTRNARSPIVWWCAHAMSDSLDINIGSISLQSQLMQRGSPPASVAQRSCVWWWTQLQTTVDF